MRRLIALAASLMLATACGPGPQARSSGSPHPSPTPAPASASQFPDIEESEALAMSEPVRFRAADGVPLEGRMFGSGQVGIVLAHMRPGDQSQWLQFAALLATEGYRVLTYNRRGTCPGGELGCSRGTARATTGRTSSRPSTSFGRRGHAGSSLAAPASGRWSRFTR